MRRRTHHDYSDYRAYDMSPEHMDTQAFAQAYGAKSESERLYQPEDSYYRPPFNDGYLPPHNSQVSNVWKTLERHKSLLKADPIFEKSIHDQINAIAESRVQHEAHIKDLDERLAHYVSVLGVSSRKNRQRFNPQVPPGAHDLAAKRTANGTMVFFKTRPLGFEVDFRSTPMRVTRVWRPDLAYLGITAEMTIDTFDGYRPSKEAIENAEPPFVIHFGNPVKEKSTKSVSFEKQSSPVENPEEADADQKMEEKLKTPEPVARTITTPDREEPETAPEISSVESVPLHPKLNLEKFSTRELGKLYGRAYGQYLEHQVLPWSKESETEKERLKILMGRIRVLLEKYSVVLEREINGKEQVPVDSTKLEAKLQKQPMHAEEIDREREDLEEVASTEASSKESEPETNSNEQSI